MENLINALNSVKWNKEKYYNFIMFLMGNVEISNNDMEKILAYLKNVK